MKKFIVLALLSILPVKALFAANPFDKFKDQLLSVARDSAQSSLDNFAKDLGALLGGGSFHQGQSLGIPGFDVGVHIPAKNVNTENTIIKTAGVDTILLPILQAEIGLPAKIDLIGRFTAYSDSTMTGFGLRYGIIKAPLPGFPSLSVQAVYNTLNVNAGDNKFKAVTMSAGAVLSFNLPVVVPYLGAGIDSTTVDPDSTIIDISGKASGYRIEGGINLSLIPLMYLQLGGMYVNGDMGYTAGFGIKF